MAKFRNLSGMKFDRWLVGEEATSNGKPRRWLCRCDCGTERWILAQSLLNRSSRSCGCLKREVASKTWLKILAGQRFGRILVTDQIERRRQVVFWFCKCDCGVEKWISAPTLRSGATRSCGCWGQEIRSQKSREARKRYRVLLSGDERSQLERIVHESADDYAVFKAQVVLLADQGSGGPAWTDRQIAHELQVKPSKVEYARTLFASPAEIQRRLRRSVERTRLDPKARELRIQARRRYDAKPEKKELKRRYVNNLPAEVRVRKSVRAKVYRQTAEGRSARERERIRQREFYRTPEGKRRQKLYFQRYKERVYKRYNERYRTDPQFRIGVSLRKRLTLALKAIGARKASRLVELIGCSIPELAAYLEKQFVRGMNWENYGEWHIDHIFPCASFDLTSPDQQKRCFHFSNLQPLWAVENIKKSDTVPVAHA